jgi:heat shock protein HslJ
LGNARKHWGNIEIMKKIHRSALFLVIGSLLVVFAAFIAFGQRSESSGTKWLLTHIDGKAISASKAFIEINNEKTRFTGHSGCNRMFGGMEVADGKLTIGPIGSTKMACLDADGDIESSFLSQLGRVNALRQNGEVLELLDGQRVALKFIAAAKEETSVKLEDKKWVLESIKGNAVEIKGEAPFISFDTTKQSAGGNTGCNLFGGSYTVEGSKLTIKDTFSTMRACIEDNRMEVERNFLDALQGVNSYEIKDGKLFLKNGDNVLLTFLGKAK